MNRLIQGDVLDVLPKLPRFQCLIADPPDNLGLKYDGYTDKVRHYDELMEAWILAAHKHSRISWISFNSIYLPLVGHIVYENFSEWQRVREFRFFVQSFTFGQNRSSDFKYGYRPILRIIRHSDCGAPAITYPQAIEVPTWRATHGDKRAAKATGVPSDCWTEFPRITGNCKERRSWHPTQLREGMIQRMVNFSTKPGDSVADCFSGTGTVLRAIKDREVTSIESSASYCEKISAEHGLGVEHL